MSPPNVRSAGVRRRMSKVSTSKAAKGHLFSHQVLQGQGPEVCVVLLLHRGFSCDHASESRSVRRCSSFHEPHPPRSAGMNKASFCQSSSSGKSRICFAAFRTVSPTDMQNSFVECNGSTRRRWMLLCGMQSLSRQLAACTAGRPAGAWLVIS